MVQTLPILIAQINPMVGAIKANLQEITEIILAHQQNHALIVFPELALCGYPPEDLLLEDDFQQNIQHALDTIQSLVSTAYIIVGHPSIVDNIRYNSFSVFHQGRRHNLYHKQKLPNYGVFDERRYFNPGKGDPCVLTVNGYRIGLCICEDLWQQGPGQALIEKSIDVLVSINASPYDYLKQNQRETLMRYYASQGPTIVYVNMVGGQDELVFDGQSFVMNQAGEIVARLPAFKALTQSINLFSAQPFPVTPLLPEEASIYQALVLGLRDFIDKNRMLGVLVGLSGGIDSALTLCIAVDALGPSRVTAVMMPSRYTLPISNTDALEQIQTLQIQSHTLSIEGLFSKALETLAKPFENLAVDKTEENIQARLRGLLLMALSNKTGYLVLTTSNKSELAVGYATLYGDMAGGYSVLKDVYKTQVYRLANYRNQISAVIPQRVIDRAPSAELAANQKDSDSLPDYETLDAILQLYVEKKCPVEEIVQAGFDKTLVERIIFLIKRAEFKRRQAAPGPKISLLAFGRDWRYPLTSENPEQK